MLFCIIYVPEQPELEKLEAEVDCSMAVVVNVVCTTPFTAIL